MVGAGIIEPLLWCLKAPGVDIGALHDVLEKIAHYGESFKTTRCVTYSHGETSEPLRGEIVENGKILAEMLSSHYPVEILRMTATFKYLSSHSKSLPNSEI
jgi:hypothetical protein